MALLILLAGAPNCAALAADPLQNLLDSAALQATDVELLFLKSVCAGNPCSLSTEAPEAGTAETRGIKPSIRAAILGLVCRRPGADLVDTRGIDLSGARIIGQLDLSYVSIPFPLRLTGCSFEKPPILEGAKLPMLDLSDCLVPGLRAEYISVDGPLTLDGAFESRGTVSLYGARVSGQLSVDGSIVADLSPYALLLTAASVGALLTKPDLTVRGALSAAFMQCSFVHLQGSFMASSDTAVNLAGIRTDGVYLGPNLEVAGTVELTGAQIRTDLFVHKARLGLGGWALKAERMSVGGNVDFVEASVLSGTTSLSGSHIGGQLICNGASFRSPDSLGLPVPSTDSPQPDAALLCDSVVCEGYASFSHGFESWGLVSLGNAQMDGSVSFIGAACSAFPTTGSAIAMEETVVRGTVEFSQGFTVVGDVVVAEADIGAFIWKDPLDVTRASLLLVHTRIGQLWLHVRDWPPIYMVEQLQYDWIGTRSLLAPLDLEDAIEWIRNGSPLRYSPQPYEQLASFCSAGGRVGDATRVQLAKNRDALQKAQLPLSQRTTLLLSGILIEYGYRPWRPLWIGLCLTFVAGVLFTLAWRRGLVRNRLCQQEVEDALFGRFRPFLFALDLFLPFSPLGVQSEWLVASCWKGANAKIRLGNRPLMWLVFATRVSLPIIGWLLVTLFVAGLSGVVRF